jgi:hypothetical protein
MTAPAAFTVVNKAGKDAYAYANSGTHGTPVWNSEDNMKDVSLGDAIELYKASIRRSRPFHTYVPTMRDLNPKFKIAWIPTDELCVSLLAAANNGTAIDMIFLDGPVATVGNQGPRADWLVEGFPRTENLSEGMEIEISLKPGLTANVPSWFVVAA